MSEIKFKDDDVLVDSYFSTIGDDALANMMDEYPQELFQMCMLLSLDYQLEIEEYNGEDNSDRRILS
jgi:hypothetical protein